MTSQKRLGESARPAPHRRRETRPPPRRPRSFPSHPQSHASHEHVINSNTRPASLRSSLVASSASGKGVSRATVSFSRVVATGRLTLRRHRRGTHNRRRGRRPPCRCFNCALVNSRARDHASHGSSVDSVRRPRPSVRPLPFGTRWPAPSPPGPPRPHKKPLVMCSSAPRSLARSPLSYHPFYGRCYVGC